MLEQIRGKEEEEEEKVILRGKRGWSSWFDDRDFNIFPL